MKRLLAVLLLTTILLTGCGTQPQYTGPMETKYVLTDYYTEHTPWWDEMPGYIHTNRYTFSYDIYGNEVGIWEYNDGELQDRTVNTYDEKGNLVKTQNYNCEGWIDLPTTCRRYTYDEQGRELSVTITEFLQGEKQVNTTTYDDEARIVIRNYNHERIHTTWLDENGQTIRELLEDSMNGTRTETVYTRTQTENGSYVILDATYTGYSNLGFTTDRSERFYDEHDNLLSGTHYQDGKLCSSYEYEYDDQGRPTQYTIWDSETGTRVFRYEYEEGKKITTKADGSVRIEYYDENGKHIRIEDYNENGVRTLTQTYTYTAIQVIPREEE